jgi:hypothetical protein
MVAAKGSPENILLICNMTTDEKTAVDNEILEMSKKAFA